VTPTSIPAEKINVICNVYPCINLYPFVRHLIFLDEPLVGGHIEINCACQEESEEITPPPSDKAILPNFIMANYIQRISLHDGSSDNIIDNSSCITIAFPVTVVVNGQQMTIDSEDDFKTVERVLDEFANDNDTLHIIFPVAITLADHSELTINNSEELEDIMEPCTEGGHDDDIECVDFKYPLTFAIYNFEHQLSDIISLNDDQELYEFFFTLEESELVSFRFPVTVVMSEGEEIMANSNDQLEEIIENAMDDCDEDDDNDHNDDDADDTALVAVLTDGMWGITYFFDGTNQTSAFADFIFTLNSDGTSLATDGTSSFDGTWKSYGDNGSLELEFDFGKETPFHHIQEDFEVNEFNSSIIKLEDDGEQNEPATALVFEKR
jgi:hypothetical protein